MACLTDKQARIDYLEASRRDLLFWLNTFGWIYEPRLLGGSDRPRILPFITWDVQDKLILMFMENFGKRDMQALKSRAIGFTWCMLASMYWCGRFMRDVTFLLASSKEAMVDKKGQPDTLFSKLDLINEKLPWWMRPRRDRQQLMMCFPETNATFNGTSTTGDIGRGGRKTAILFDEFAQFELGDGFAAEAASQAVTNMRIFGSTPRGASGAFYERWRKQDAATARIQMHWSQNPIYNQGLYTSEKNVLKIIDEDWWDKRPQLRSHYTFRTDNKLRSPQYDIECDRATVATHIAQEFECDFLGSGSMFFDVDMLRRVESMFVRDEDVVGDLVYDATDLAGEKRFQPNPQGRIRLWFPLDDFLDRPKPGKYVIGCDISSGTGASNTCFCILDEVTGEQVAELASPTLRPVDAARYAVAMAHWFSDEHGKGAKIIWEGNGGPGRNFGDAMAKDFGYRNIYYQKSERKLVPTETENPGWWSTRENKVALLNAFAEALASGQFVPRSRELLAECREYQYTSDGGIDHVRSIGTLDPSGAGQNHGDRAIGAALTTRFADVQMKALARTRETHPESPAAWEEAINRNLHVRSNRVYRWGRTFHV